MLLNAVHYFILQLTVLFLFIAETSENTIDDGAAVSKGDDAFFPHIFKFLYKNEQLFSADCASELQRLLVTSAFTNTTRATTTDVTLANVTTISNTIINNTNNTIKYHKGKDEVWNELHRRIRTNHGNSNIIDATRQPAPKLRSGHSGKREETRFKRKFHGKIIKNEKAIHNYRKLLDELSSVNS
ncbi:unnamed protein product [Cercopithifilaria johnstoni]|uniref:Uncharacterized protein n=1 Tax=Cercopithifilaria johnstoni TaxID=2874296 RepID=A0A8J2MTI8_9BILA|nr:unnamed protein product [Cercopithifilaria johnstoni]